MEKNEKNLIPEVWYIKPKTKYEHEEMIKWRGGSHLGEFGTSYLLSERWWSLRPNSGGEITFEQFEKYVLGRQPTKNKEIIGYKLLKELPFVEVGVESYLNSKNECSFITNSASIQDAFVFTKEELEEKPDWFEPIYKKKEKTFKLSNGKEVRINKKGIYADGVNGEISILGLKNLLRPGQTSLNFLTVELKDATFKIGCWENVKFSEIKEMLEIYENLKK